MKNLLRAYNARLFKNKLFIGAAILAFAITAWFTRFGKDLGVIHYPRTDFDFSLIAALGIPCFFSVLTPMFLGSEYQGGAIKNKIILAKSRKDIYFSSLISLFTALLIMTAAWLAGAVFGAESLPSAEYIAVSTVKILAYNLANISFLAMLGMNMTRVNVCTAIEMVSFQSGFFIAFMIHTLMCDAPQAVFAALKLLLNAIPYGQWLCSTILSDESAAFETPLQLGLSAVIFTLMTLKGLSLLQKKDIV